MTRVVPQGRGTEHSPVVLLDGSGGLPRTVLGSKGYGIDAMRRHGLPVPPAFAVTTEVGALLVADPQGCLEGIWDQVYDKMRRLERETSRSFGRGPRPLLVSVRSSPVESMPGMMDTVLNVGIDDAVEDALAAAASAEFARDTRDRLREMYRRIVLGGHESAQVPEDPGEQLREAIKAVFSSWNSERAIAYREHHGYNQRDGTGVVVQAMVFGNMARDSGTGVLFSRNPVTGANEPFGEWLPGGQGEDVVSGRLDVQPITALHEEQPAISGQLLSVARTLEELGRDVQDIEFTVEEGVLWLLQTRAAKLSAQAAVRLALQLRDEGLIDDAGALRRVSAAQVETLLRPGLQPETRLAAPLLAKGLPVSLGVASGRAYTDLEEAIDAAEAGENVILVRTFTSPDDVGGMLSARGIVTETGGATSHAAVVSREIGRPAVVGCGGGVAEALRGKLITIDGTHGEVREGVLELTAWSENDSPELNELAEIARRICPLRAHASGDYPVVGNHSDAAVRAALSAGHTDVVSPTPLITMLTALRLTNHEGTDAVMSDLELKVLQAIRLKGRVDQAAVAATVDEEPATVAPVIADLTKAGLVRVGGTLRISRDGRARLDELLAQERSGIDTAAVAAAYGDFRGVNADFKELVSDWQSKDGHPNTHQDGDYDAAVLARLHGVHQRVVPIITAAAAQIPRLRAYSDKLDAALAKIRVGETIWLTRPIIDSYHTVWFELHEELIQAAGRSREDEAKAGHAG